MLDTSTPPPCPACRVDCLPPELWPRYWQLFPRGNAPTWKAFPRDDPRREWARTCWGRDKDDEN